MRKIGPSLSIQELHQGFSGRGALLPRTGRHPPRHQGSLASTQPENLLLSTNQPDALLKLSDFGISKILAEGELCTTCGTPIYMAPEIWRMEPYNSKVDIWSIGVVTYYLYCKCELVFRASTPS